MDQLGYFNIDDYIGDPKLAQSSSYLPLNNLKDFYFQKYTKKANIFEVLKLLSYYDSSLFKMIQEESGTDWNEMYKVFNMGHRMELYLPENIAQDIIGISESFGIPAQIVGFVENAESKKVTIRSAFGEFIY